MTTLTPEQRLANFRAFQAADNKFRQGDGINDVELKLLIGRYSAAAEAMRAIWHPEYNLIENDIASKLRTLEGFRDARRRDA